MLPAFGGFPRWGGFPALVRMENGKSDKKRPYAKKAERFPGAVIVPNSFDTDSLGRRYLVFIIRFLEAV